MANLPRKKPPVLLPGALTLPVAPGTTQDFWDNSAEVIDDFTVSPLRAYSAGELIYTGPSLQDAMGKLSTEDADYNLNMHVLGTKALQFELRTRREDADNYIALEVDFSENTMRLLQVVSGVETVLTEDTRTLEYEAIRSYTFAISVMGENIFGFINGYSLLTASSAQHKTKSGVSLFFPRIDSEEAPIIFGIEATEAIPYVGITQDVDPSDLYLQFRLLITEEIENPTEKTWATYQRALKLYEQRNVGSPDETWASRGYPLRKPSAEEWFGGA